MTKKNFTSCKPLIISIVAIFVVGIIAAIVFIPRAIEAYRDSQVTYAQPVGKLVIGEDAALKKVVTEYAIASAKESLKHYGDGSGQTISCAITMYGYDERYVYAMDRCEWVETRGGYAVPTRFEYQRDPLRVTDSVRSADSGLQPTTQSIFPKEMYKELYRVWLR